MSDRGDGPYDPDNRGLRIDSVWVFISSDHTGEGVCAAPIEPGVPSVPLIAADEARLESLRPIAKRLAATTAKTIKLIRLTVREDLEIITP